MHSVIDEIQLSNSWRDGEFAAFKANQNKVKDSLWFRMCVPMIYAHWEGFVVDALKIMLSFLNRKCLKPGEVRTELVVVGLGDGYKTLSGKQSFSQRINFTEKFFSLLSQELTFSTKVSTKSNLKKGVFQDICVMFGFDYSKFSECMPDIDRLVHVRNSIAHGENSYLPDGRNIDQYIFAVKEAMDLLLEEIDSFLMEEKYLHSGQAA